MILDQMGLFFSYYCLLTESSSDMICISYKKNSGSLIRLK